MCAYPLSKLREGPGDEAIVRVDEVGNEDHHGASVPLYGLRTLLSQANLARHSCQKFPLGSFPATGGATLPTIFPLFLTSADRLPTPRNNKIFGTTKT